MKNSIRCCISCILPCGALDVIRIVHSNGRVEEISGTIRAADIMKAYPKHVLKKPSTSASDDGPVPKIVVVSPDAELQRGKIYFLMPLPPNSTSSSSSSTPPKKKKHKNINVVVDTSTTTTTTTATSTGSKDSNNSSRSKKRRPSSSSSGNYSNISDMTTNLLISDQYLSEILSEKVSTQRDRRRGRVGVWRPHLESISESPIDASL